VVLVIVLIAFIMTTNDYLGVDPEGMWDWGWDTKIWVGDTNIDVHQMSLLDMCIFVYDIVMVKL